MRFFYYENQGEGSLCACHKLTNWLVLIFAVNIEAIKMRTGTYRHLEVELLHLWKQDGALHGVSGISLPQLQHYLHCFGGLHCQYYYIIIPALRFSLLGTALFPYNRRFEHWSMYYYVLLGALNSLNIFASCIKITGVLLSDYFYFNPLNN